MDLRDTPEEAAFRSELRAWIETNLTDEVRRGRFEEAGRDWSRKLHEAGYAGLTWPKEYGGASARTATRRSSSRRWRAPRRLRISASSASAWPGRRSSRTAPTPRSRSTSRRSCPPRRSGARASPSPAPAPTSPRCARARRRENGNFVVNGQKVWSSFAHIADWCILVTRSDPDSERHAGLTYLLVDMHAPGVDVRPLRQITGEAEFNEIFFTDVEVPVENAVGRHRRAAGRSR